MKKSSCFLIVVSIACSQLGGQVLESQMPLPEREPYKLISAELARAMQEGKPVRVIAEVKRNSAYGAAKSPKELALWAERSRLADDLVKGKRRSVFGAVPVEAEQKYERNLVELRREIFEREKLALHPDKLKVEEFLKAFGAKRVRSVDLGGIVSAEAAPLVIEALAASGLVRRIYLDKPAKLLNQFPYSVGTYSLGSHYFWQAGWIGQGQSVAVIDSGIDTGHPYFVGLNIESKSFLLQEDIPEELRVCLDDKLDSPHDFNGHGSHVAGTIAGRAFGQHEYSFGVSPGIEKLYSLKVGFQLRHDEHCPGTAPISVLATYRALEYLLTETPVKIVNYSAGSDLACEVEEYPTSRLFDAFVSVYPDLAITVAAGNSGPDLCTINSPGNAYNILSVGNVDHSWTFERWDDLPHWSSSRGRSLTGRMKPDLAAPGTGILSAQANTGALVEMGGTSMAAPHIAGALALLSESGISNPLQAKALLVNSSDSVSWSNAEGWGQANLERALAMRGTAQVVMFDPKEPQKRLRYLRVKDVPGVLATLAWNRHIEAATGILAEFPWRLSMGLYDAQTGATIRDVKNPDRTVQNLLKLGAETSREAVLRISVDDLSFFEQEAVLEVGFSSTSGWNEIAAPALSLSCIGPESASPGENFEVNCTIRNSGQAPLHNLKIGTLNIPRIAGNSLEIATLQVKATTVPGPTSALVEVRAHSYGYVYTSSDSVRFVVTAPSARIGEILFTKSQPLSNCTRPIASQTFSISDSRVWIWASVFGVGQGQTWKVDIRNPLGGLHRSFGPYAFPTSGDFCLYPDISLPSPADNLMTGTWTASVEIDGRLRGSSTFQVVAPQPTVTSVVFTPYAPNLSSCAVPFGFGTISRSAPIVHSWFAIDNLTLGAVAQIRWISPSGQLVLRTDMRPVSSAGSWCFSSNIAMSQLLPTSIPGTWRVEIAVGGIMIRSATFNMI